MEGIFYHNNGEQIELFRFYKDLEVITVNYDYTDNLDQTLIDGFDRNHKINQLYPELYSKAKYSKIDEKLKFTIKTKFTTVDYEVERINEDELKINSYSHTTDYKSEKRFSPLSYFPKRNDNEYTASSYPIVLIPQNIKLSVINNPREKEIFNYLNIAFSKLEEASLPDKPKRFKYVGKKKTNFNGDGCTAIASIPMLLFFIVMAFYTLNTGEYLLALMFGIFSAFTFPQVFKFKTIEESEKVYLSSEEYQEKLREFENEVKSIKIENKKKKESYEKEKEIINSKIESKKPIAIKDIYFKKLKPKNSNLKKSNPAKRGRAELIFLDDLLRHFGDQIKMDLSPEIPFKSYFPDFVLICDVTGLHIDIEIDEPYTFKENEPIHFVGSKDDERNKFFLEQNWVVIRFSEKQIYNERKECINLINNVLNALRNKSLKIEHNLIEDSKWTYEEALVMAGKNQRNSY